MIPALTLIAHHPEVNSPQFENFFKFLLPEPKSIYPDEIDSFANDLYYILNCMTRK